jgi:uncharacterized membrane protein HdeD (DUF308 family)
MPHEVHPLDCRTVPEAPVIRPHRLIIHVYVAAALCVFALVLDVHSGFDWEVRHLAIVRSLIGAYGVIAGIVCFVRGGLRLSDRWCLLLAGLICLIAGVAAILMPRLIHN